MIVRVQNYKSKIEICHHLRAIKPRNKFITRSQIVSLSQFINIRFLVKRVSWINSCRLQ